jgi:hypothetical protein
MHQTAAAVAAVALVACLIGQLPALDGAAAPRKGIELARPGTLKGYIDKYTGGEDVGCTIGGQTFRNFKLQVVSSIVEAELKGEPQPATSTLPSLRMVPVDGVP